MDFKYILRRRGAKPPADTSVASLAVASRTRRFHRTIPGYAPTPLVSLPGLARELGVARIFVKDESPRFGLNAFKSLGGSYAVASILAGRLGKDLDTLGFEDLVRGRNPDLPDDQTFITAWLVRSNVA